MSSFKISSITNLQHLFNAGMFLGVPIQYNTALVNNNSIFFNASLGVWENGTGGSGGISVPDGTVSAPGLFFTTEPDTGLYKVAPLATGFTVGGLEVMQTIQTTSGRPKVMIGNNESANSSTLSPFLQVAGHTMYNRVYDSASGGSKTFTFILEPNSFLTPTEYSPCLFDINITTGTKSTLDATVIGSKRLTVGIMRTDNNTLSSSTVLEDINSGVFPSVSIDVGTLVNGFSVTVVTPSTGVEMKNVFSINFLGGEMFLQDVLE